MKISWVNSVYLRKKYENLLLDVNPNRRGRDFEKFIYHLFRSSGFQVSKNKRSSYNEEIDLIVHWGQFWCIVETKWHKNPIGIKDIQALNWRLRQRGSVTIGILISMSGFSENSINEAVSSQDKSLILLDQSDVLSIIAEKYSSDLEDLLNKKLNNLLLRKIEFTSDNNSSALKKLISPIDLVSFEEKWHFSSGKIGTLKQKIPENHKLSEVIIFNEVIKYKNDLQRLKLFSLFKDHMRYSVKDINRIIENYNYLFGFTENGSFCIGQNKINWQGFGITEFIKAIKNQNLRYQDIDKDGIHHSEIINYFEPIFSTSSYFIINFDQFISREEINENNHFIRNFEPKLLLDSNILNSEFMELINKFCKENNYSLIQDNFEVDIMGIAVEDLKINIIPTECILDSTIIEGEEWIMAFKFNNPCNDIQILKSRVSRALPKLSQLPFWIGYLRNKTTSPLKEDLILEGIRILKINLGTHKLYVTHIIVN